MKWDLFIIQIKIIFGALHHLHASKPHLKVRGNMAPSTVTPASGDCAFSAFSISCNCVALVTQHLVLWSLRVYIAFPLQHLNSLGHFPSCFRA